MNIKLLTEHHLEFLRFKGGCTGSPESTLVKIPHCWKSHVTAHNIMLASCSVVNFLANVNQSTESTDGDGCIKVFK